MSCQLLISESNEISLSLVIFSIRIELRGISDGKQKMSGHILGSIIFLHGISDKKQKMSGHIFGSIIFCFPCFWVMGKCVT